MPSTANKHIQLPFDCFRGPDWEAAVLASLKRASDEAGVSGIFFLVAAPQGYIFQHLAVCHENFRAEGVVWSSVTNKAESWQINFAHDPVRSLDCLDKSWRGRNVSGGAGRDSTRGRDVSLFITAGGQGSWIRCQTPLEGAAKYDELDALILDLQRIPKTRQPGVDGS